MAEVSRGTPFHTRGIKVLWLFALFPNFVWINVVGFHPTRGQGGLLVLAKYFLVKSQFGIRASRSKRSLT
ncbi:hypothetical protein SHLO109777_07590 [Shewanella loihica]